MGEPAGKRFACHVLADDGYRLRCGGVLGTEVAASQDAESAWSLKYAVADDVVVTFTSRSTGMPGTRMLVFQLPSMKGERRKAGRLHSRKRVDAVLDLMEQDIEAGIVPLVARDVGVDVEAQHIFLVEAGVDTVQVDERAQEETGATIKT